MKAVKILIIAMLAGLCSQAQTVTPNPGPYQNISTKYQYTWQKWSGGIWNLGKLVQADSAQFLGPVYVPNALAGDSSTLAANTGWIKRWIAENVSPGIPGQPTSAWSYNGNIGDTASYDGLLGMLDNYPLKVITNGVVRLIVPEDGINRSSGAANKVLVIDTVTKKVYYTDMASGGSGSGITSLGSGWGLNNVNDSTYEVDSTEVATQYDLSSGLAGKLNISDTAAMMGNTIRDIHAGTNLSIDKTDPRNPVISASGGASIPDSGTIALRPASGDFGERYFQTNEKAGWYTWNGRFWEQEEPYRVIVDFKFPVLAYNNPVGIVLDAANGGDWRSETGYASAIAGSMNVRNFAFYTAAATARSGYRYGIGSNLSTFYYGSDSGYVFHSRVWLSHVSDATDTYILRVGHNAGGGASDAQGTYFSYTHSANSGQWQCITTGVGNTTINTSTAFAAQTAYDLVIVKYPGSTKTEFFINGALVGQSTGVNVPVLAYDAGAWITRSAGTAARFMFSDRLKIYQW